LILSMNPDLWYISNTEMSIRILIALAAGGLIGIERELGNHSAGFRTHILVCVGSTLIALLSIYGFAQFAYETNVRMDPARLAAQVISGIGFLGAGTIMRMGPNISGLTTAASLWIVAAIGLSIGAGFYFGAIVSTGLVIVILFFFNIVEKSLLRNRKKSKFTVWVNDHPEKLESVIDMLISRDMQILNFKRMKDEGEAGGEKYVCMEVKFTLKKGFQLEEITKLLLKSAIKVDFSSRGS